MVVKDNRPIAGGGQRVATTPVQQPEVQPMQQPTPVSNMQQSPAGSNAGSAGGGSENIYKADYVDPGGQQQEGYIKDGRTYTDPGLTTEVAPGSTVTDASGREWAKPGGAVQTTYTDANGQAQTGYIINGATYTDPNGQNPVGVGSVVKDQSGREWIKTENGSMLYSEYLAQQKGSAPESDAPTVDMLTRLNDLLTQWKTAAEQQAAGQTDYATQQAIAELERTLADAQPKFKTQQDQITADEMAARDNAALYAEMRGDKGGIGQGQYNAIANTAAINRQTVASEQTKLSTDTARQIADLRAQGEFEKADKLLEIAQTYLSQLVTLEQWAAEYGQTAEQFNESIRQWEAEFQNVLAQQGFDNDMTMAQWEWQQKQQEVQNAFNEAGLTGVYNGELTIDGKNQISDIAAALLDAGFDLTDEQLSALGITREQADAYQLAAQVTAKSGGTGGTTGGTKSELYETIVNTVKDKPSKKSAVEYLEASVDAGYITEAEAAQILIAELGYTNADYIDLSPSLNPENADDKGVIPGVTGGTGMMTWADIQAQRDAAKTYSGR